MPSWLASWRTASFASFSLESEGARPTTEQIADIVIKVVRELGQPALAEAFARFGQAQGTDQLKEASDRDSDERRGGAALFTPSMPLSAVLPSCVREYTLQTVFTRDLAAQSAGLLTLTGLEFPRRNWLAACWDRR